MKNIKSNLLMSFMLSSLLVTSFSIFATEGEYPANVSAAIETAEKARLEAKERGFEWSTTSILIRSAMEAAENGNSEEALALAEKALKEAENSIKQADYAAKNWLKFAI